MISIIKKFKDSIGANLFKKVYITYFIFAFIFVACQVYLEYKSEEKQAFKVLLKIEKIYEDILVKSIKEKDIKELTQITNAIRMTTDIAGVAIFDEKKRFVFLNGTVSTDIKNMEQMLRFPNLNYNYSNSLITNDLEFTHDNKKFYIFLFIDENEIFNNTKDSILLILLNILASMIVLGILFFIFSTKHIVKPLNTIIDATKNFDVVEHEVIEIKLDNKEKNELNKLASTFNKMSKRINEAYINMQQLTMIREIQKNKLEEQKKELVDANKSKDDFMANMSHELKTPLNSINVISNVMMKNKRGVLNEKDVKNLEIINKCGKDLLFLINDVLDLSKLEAGEMILNNDKINLKKLMDSIYDMFAIQVKEKNLNFIYEVDKSIEYIFSDKDRIKQIIKNLLSNALKFTQEGTIKFLVENDNEHIKVTIEDSGIGIEKAKLEHIFDRFKQVDGSTTRKYGGTGLGLAICKDLSRLLQGDVTVSSETDKGSRFVVTIHKNEELLKGIDILSIKDDDESTEKEKSIKVEKEKMVILNNDPIVFLNLVIELNKVYNIHQVFEFDELKNFADKDDKILLDIDKLNDEEKEFLINNFEGKLIFIYENEIEEKYINLAESCIKKPLTEEVIRNL